MTLDSLYYIGGQPIHFNWQQCPGSRGSPYTATGSNVQVAHNWQLFTADINTAAVSTSKAKPFPHGCLSLRASLITLTFMISAAGYSHDITNRWHTNGNRRLPARVVFNKKPCILELSVYHGNIILGFGVQGGNSLKTILGSSNKNHVETMNKNELNTVFVRQTQHGFYDAKSQDGIYDIPMLDAQSQDGFLF